MGDGVIRAKMFERTRIPVYGSTQGILFPGEKHNRRRIEIEKRD